MNKKFDHFISTALRDTKTCDTFFQIINHFSLLFNFLTLKELYLHCSLQNMLRTKQTLTYTYYKFSQHHYTTNTPSRNPQHQFQFINAKYTSPFFLKLTYCIKDTNMQGFIRHYEPIRQMYIFCPLIRTFNVDESRPLIVPYEYIQPVEVPILECIGTLKPF